jgi:hypothetical protein
MLPLETKVKKTIPEGRAILTVIQKEIQSWKRKTLADYLPVALVAAAIIISVLVLSNAFLNRNRNEDIIYTTVRYGSMNFESDLVVWSASFYPHRSDLQSAYADLQNDQAVIEEYLRENGVEAGTFVFFRR